MFCDQCGAELPDDSVFCPKCGARLTSVDSEANNAAGEAAPEAENTAGNAPENMTNVSSGTPAAEPPKKKKGFPRLLRPSASYAKKR